MESMKEGLYEVKNEIKQVGCSENAEEVWNNRWFCHVCVGFCFGLIFCCFFFLNFNVCITKI